MIRREIIPNAEPFFMPGNRIGCLLIHGFTGAPAEMLPLGEYLNQLGYSVLGVRLTGHGTNIDAMIRSRWQDWVASVEDGWHLLRSATDQIFIIGLSMGGVLTLVNAPKLNPKGIVVMSTPSYFPNKFIDKYPWLVKLLSRIFSKQTKGEGGWVNKDAALDHVSYEANPIRSTLELKSLISKMNNIAPQLDLPTLVIHSKHDNYVTPDHAEKLYGLLKMQDREMFWIENSDHVITRDGDPHKVFDKIADFIKERSN